MPKIDKQLQPHLWQGETQVEWITMSGSVDLPSDVPFGDHTAFLTDARFILLNWRTGAVYWWVQLDHISSVHTEKRWQKGIAQKGRETIFDLYLHDGQRFRGITVNDLAGNRRIKKFADALQRSVGYRDRPGL